MSEKKVANMQSNIILLKRSVSQSSNKSLKTTEKRPRGEQKMYPVELVMGQYNDVECMLATCAFHDVAKHGCNYYNIVNKIDIRQKIGCHAIPASRFVVEHNIKARLSIM